MLNSYLLKPETVQAIARLGPTADSIADRWAVGWKAETKAMEREGTLIDRLKEAATAEAEAIARARAGGENSHLADGELREMLGIDPGPYPVDAALPPAVHEHHSDEPATTVDMSFETFLEANKARLLGFYLLSKLYPGHCGLETPDPTAELSDDEIQELKTHLSAFMPRDSFLLDLKSWDVHFDDELGDDWFFETTFGHRDTAIDCAEDLSVFFLEKVDEYDIDYNQQGEEAEFEARVRDEAVKFVRSWRQRIAERASKNISLMQKPGS